MFRLRWRLELLWLLLTGNMQIGVYVEKCNLLHFEEAAFERICRDGKKTFVIYLYLDFSQWYIDNELRMLRPYGKLGSIKTIASQPTSAYPKPGKPEMHILYILIKTTPHGPALC